MDQRVLIYHGNGPSQQSLLTYVRDLHVIGMPCVSHVPLAEAPWGCLGGIPGVSLGSPGISYRNPGAPWGNLAVALTHPDLSSDQILTQPVVDCQGGVCNTNHGNGPS